MIVINFINAPPSTILSFIIILWPIISFALFPLVNIFWNSFYERPRWKIHLPWFSASFYFRVLTPGSGVCEFSNLLERFRFRGVASSSRFIMRWFEGSIPAAIASAKQLKCVFVVVITGNWHTDPMCVWHHRWLSLISTHASQRIITPIRSDVCLCHSSGRSDFLLLYWCDVILCAVSAHIDVLRHQRITGSFPQSDEIVYVMKYLHIVPFVQSDSVCVFVCSKCLFVWS